MIKLPTPRLSFFPLKDKVECFGREQPSFFVLLASSQLYVGSGTKIIYSKTIQLFSIS
jgi:hypothetical protein